MLNSTCAIIVTHNRKDLLLRCLEAVSSQSCKPDKILIVDNASTDGTCETLEAKGWLGQQWVQFLRLDENIGGAGGFAMGISHAIESGHNWLWLMDDDGYPEHKCLELLQGRIATEGGDAVSPMQVDISDHALPAFPIVDRVGKYINSLPYEPTDSTTYIRNIANLFNGMLVNTATIDKVGLPRKELFIRGDEVDYVKRMVKLGIMFGTEAGAYFFHPSDRHERFKLICGRINARDAGNDFKNYYLFRNKALAFKEDGQLWLVPFDLIRYVYFFFVCKKLDIGGFMVWLRATKDALLGKLGRHPTY